VTRRLLLALAIAAIVAATPRWLTAHPGHPHTLLGTVTAVAAGQVTLKTRDATVVTVYLDGDTKIVKDKKPAKPGDISPGMRAAVTAVTVTEKGVEKAMAKRIELGAAGAAR
jgi:hypothetical protein